MRLGPVVALSAVALAGVGACATRGTGSASSSASSSGQTGSTGGVACNSTGNSAGEVYFQRCAAETAANRTPGFKTFYRELMVRACERDTRCFNTPSCPPPRSAACETLENLDAIPLPPDFVYDAACGELCLAAVAASPCSEGRSLPVSCVDAQARRDLVEIEPPFTQWDAGYGAGVGESCLNGPCGGGLFCERTMGNPDQGFVQELECPVCQPRERLGGACHGLEPHVLNVSGGCLSTATCASGGFGTCRDPYGDPDANPLPGTRITGECCSADTECGSGLCLQGRCTPAGMPEGAPCVDSRECQTGPWRTNSGHCASGVCACGVDPAELQPVGARCSGNCQAGLRCLYVGGESTCHALIADGQPCVEMDGVSACAGVCVTAGGAGQGACVPEAAPGEGEPCAAGSAGWVCAPGLWLDVTRAGCTCRDRLTDGAPCSYDAQCIHRCVGLQCRAPQPPQPLDAVCALPEDCESAWCPFGRCAERCPSAGSSSSSAGPGSSTSSSSGG